MDIKQLLQYNEYQNKIYIHNEIFEELKLLHDKGSSHVAFAYTYYFLICWLYRYAKYGELNIDVKLIKQIMGYSATYQEINYLIKKNGWLDQNGLTYSDTNYPLVWEWKDDELEFTYLSDMDVEIKNMYIANKGRNYKIKVPVKALHRNDDELLDGTFYDISYTHEVSFDLFVKCVSDKELGCSAFYLYGYLKYRCDKFKEYNSSVERLAKETGMSKNTVDKYLTSLCRNGLVKYKENECKKINGEFNKKANTYMIN